jgi:hypothetical protein
LDRVRLSDTRGRQQTYNKKPPLKAYPQSELGVGGCYVDALTPFPEGTLVKLRILRDQGAFESNGKVVYTHANFGMGVAFTDLTFDQRSILESWIAEIVSQPRRDLPG